MQNLKASEEAMSAKELGYRDALYRAVAGLLPPSKPERKAVKAQRATKPVWSHGKLRLQPRNPDWRIEQSVRWQRSNPRRTPMK
jgi:hypothetical protein